MTELTPQEMDGKVRAIIGTLQEIDGVLQGNLARGSVDAQTARMVAFGLANLAGALLEAAAGSLPYLLNPPVADATDDVQEFFSMRFNVEKAAVHPSLSDLNCRTIALVESLIAAAKSKISQAEQTE